MIKEVKGMKKRKVLIAGLLAISGFCLFGFAAHSMNNQVVFAEEEVESSEPEVVDESEVETETEAEPEVPEQSEDEAEKVTNKFKQIWETYLLPAVLSVNIGSIIATITSIALAIKNHTSHKDYTTKVTGIIRSVVELSTQMTTYIVLLAEKNETTQRLLDAVQEASDTTLKQIALFEEQKASYEKLKEAAVGLINIEVELAKVSPEFVTSGVAEKIVDLKTQLLDVVK